MTRDELVTAKDNLDNYDQITGAMATFAQQKGGSVTLNVSPSVKLRVPVADLLVFLADQQGKISTNLAKTYNVALT